MACRCPKAANAPSPKHRRVAEGIGFPVTLKVSSAAIAHKTEAGGVKLNLHRQRMRWLPRPSPWRTSLTLCLVERMVRGAVAELIIGVKRDPQFGLALVVGAGGILTELLKDSAALLLPTSRTEIERAVKCLKVLEADRRFSWQVRRSGGRVCAPSKRSQNSQAQPTHRWKSLTSIPCSSCRTVL